MAIDIQEIISANVIKNGSEVIGTSGKGDTQEDNQFVNNEPDITDIESKYGNRFKV